MLETRSLGAETSGFVESVVVRGRRRVAAEESFAKSSV